MNELPLGVRISILLRSLLVQAAWNYRTMLGTGMAFALLPALRYLHRDPAELDAAVRRHAGHFNAHPYLTPVALGALARMEMEGAPPEAIERFRAALRGPLGALGDRLVWAGWLPLCALLGVVVVRTVSPGAGVVAFLACYNILHMTLRVRGLRLGWESGARVGSRIRDLDLPHRARQVEGGVALALGLVVALWLPGVGIGPVGPDTFVWSGGSVAAILLGYVAGPRIWRPAAVVMVLAIVGVALFVHAT